MWLSSNYTMTTEQAFWACNAPLRDLAQEQCCLLKGLMQEASWECDVQLWYQELSSLQGCTSSDKCSANRTLKSYARDSFV